MAAWIPSAELSPVQERVLDVLCKEFFSHVDAAVVILKPDIESQGESATPRVQPLALTLIATAPFAWCAGTSIVHVTETWERVTGTSAEEAVGRAGSFAMHGPLTDPAVLSAISRAMAAGRACKALVASYRSGDPAKPFWNMLSLSPVVHEGELVFHLANLQDYSEHIARLASPPRSFCRSSAYHQRRVPLLPPALLLTERRSRLFATPAVLEADAQAYLPGPAAAPGAGRPLIRRLGWSGVPLEPEHLAARIADGARSMGADVGTQESSTEWGEQWVVDARIGAELALRIVICAAETDRAGECSIACTRLAGDTSEYHSAYKTLSNLICAQDFAAAPRPKLRIVSSYGGGLASVAGWN